MWLYLAHYMTNIVFLLGIMNQLWYIHPSIIPSGRAVLYGWVGFFYHTVHSFLFSNSKSTIFSYIPHDEIFLMDISKYSLEKQAELIDLRAPQTEITPMAHGPLPLLIFSLTWACDITSAFKFCFTPASKVFLYTYFGPKGSIWRIYLSLP